MKELQSLYFSSKRKVESIFEADIWVLTQEDESTMEFIDLPVLKIYKHFHIKRVFMKKYIGEVYIYVVKYENLLKKILLVI